jgi:hypothetical protein
MIIGNLKKPGGRNFVCVAVWGYNYAARPACDAGEGVI